MLTRADQPSCLSHARVTIMDPEGTSARACPRRAIAALDGIASARVDWAASGRDSLPPARPRLLRVTLGLNVRVLPHEVEHAITLPRRQV